MRCRHLAGLAVAALTAVALAPPSVARAASPTGAPNDSFLCYKARRDAGAPRFDYVFGLPLEDALESGPFDVRKRRGLCNPADRDGGGVVDATTHLLVYDLRSSTGGPSSSKYDLLILDQFGLVSLTTRKADRLMVPSPLDPNEPVPPLDPGTHAVDHYKCYRARVTKGTPRFPKGVQTTVLDTFDEPALLDVKKPTRVCLPVALDGQPILNAFGHLSCYKVKEASGVPKHEKRSGLHSNNELESANPDGPPVLKTSRRDELCVPAVVVPAPTACAMPASDGGPLADLCTPAVPAGAEYWVATDGSDATGTGSALAPWATIGYAVTHVPDGATITVRPGTYTGRVALDVAFPLGITIRSEVPYQARLRNDASVVAAFTGQGYTVEGFDIAHSGPGAGPLVVQIQDLRGDPGGDDFTGRITLRNNVIHDSWNNDLLKVNNGAGNVIVEGNVFYNQTGDDEHIDMNSVRDVVVRDNVFFNDFAGSGRTNANDTSSFIVVKDTSVGLDLNYGSAGVAIRRNVFASWEGRSGAHFVLVGNDNQTYFGADGVLVENNLMLGNAPNVIRAAVGVKGARCVDVRHNTVAGNLPSLAYAMRVSSEAANPPNEEISFRGNVFADPTGTMDDFSDGPPDETLTSVLDNNLYWNGGLAIPFDAADLLNAADDARAVLGDPALGDQAGLVVPRWDPDAGVFADGSTTICQAREGMIALYGVPGTGSAVVDAADPAHAPDHDILGLPRPAGGAPDLGAVEAE